MRIVLRLLLVFVVLPGSVAAFLFHLDQKGFFDLDEIEIVLEDTTQKSLHLKPLVSELEAALQTYKGQSLWSLKMQNLSDTLESRGWIDTHSLSREWPRKLVVKVRPQEVKALYLSSKTLIPVVREGRFLAPIEPSLAPDVVVLEGKVFEDENFRRRAVEVIDEVPDEGPFSKKTISELRWSKRDGFSMTMVESAVEVKVGEDKVALKAARVSQVLEYLKNRGIQPKSLDANLSKKVLVRLESGTSTF